MRECAPFMIFNMVSGLPAEPMPHNIYFVLTSTNTVAMYVTSKDGKTYLVGTQGDQLTLTSPNGTITITNGNEIDVAQSVLDTIISLHNSFPDLQGGQPGQRYHLDLEQYNYLTSLSDNRLVQIGNIEQSGLTVTLEDVIWIINGTTYSDASQLFNIQEATDGNYRIDIVVGNNSGQLVLIQGTESETNPVEPAIPLDTILVTRINVFGDTISVTPDPEIPNLQEVMDNGSIGIVNKPISIINADFDTETVLGIESFPNIALILYKQTPGGSAGIEFRVGQQGITVYDDESYIGLQGAAYYGANATSNTYVQKKYVEDGYIKIDPSPAVTQEGQGRLYFSDGFQTGGTSSTYPYSNIVPGGVSTASGADTYAQLNSGGLLVQAPTKGFQINNPIGNVNSLMNAPDASGTIALESYVDDATLRQLGWKSPQDYGAVGDGVTDDTLAVQQCNLENNNPFWFGTYLVTETIEFRENQTLFSNNATIKRFSNTGDILFFDDVNNFSIVGNLTIEGNGKSNNSAVGLHIEKGDNFKIEGVTIKNIAGKGIYFTGESINRGNRGVLSNVSLQNNWIGAGWQALAEYSTLKNVNAQGNSIGLEILAGNVGIIGGSITDNDNGIYIGGAYATNNSHGIFQGLNVNHNTGYDLKAENVQYGQTITGCHFYGTSSEGGVQLVNSYGVMFNGCILDGILSNTDSNTPKGFNMINACQLEPEFTLSGDPVLLRNCFIKNAGLSPLNNYDAYGNNEVLASGYDDFGNMSVRTLDNFGAGVGGTLSFAGSAGGSIQFDAAFGKIKGYKLDSSSGFIDGVLAFGTSNNSVAPYFNYHMYLNHLGNLLLGNSTDSGSGAKLQVNGRASGSDAVNTQDYVTLGQLNTAGRIKTTASTTTNTIVVPATATSYRLNPGVISVTLPTLTGNAGIILFFVNNTGGDVILNSNSGGNDIWYGAAVSASETLPQGTVVRVLHDGTSWSIL